VATIDFMDVKKSKEHIVHVKTVEDDAIELTFTVSTIKQEYVNALIVKTDFVQYVGVYNGVLKVGDYVLYAKECYGVYERHYALW